MSWGKCEICGTELERYSDDNAPGCSFSGCSKCGAEYYDETNIEIEDIKENRLKDYCDLKNNGTYVFKEWLPRRENEN